MTDYTEERILLANDMESTCWVCMGSGSIGLGFWDECPRCFGTGTVDREPTQDELDEMEEMYSWGSHMPKQILC